MVKTKFLPVLMVIASAAAFAQAAVAREWFVGGVSLTSRTPKTEEFTLKSLLVGDIVIGNKSFTVECTAGKTSNNLGLLQEEIQGNINLLEFSGCSVKNEVANCEVTNKEVLTQNMEFFLEGIGYINIFPEGASFGSIKIQKIGTNVCGVAGTYSLGGTIRGRITVPESEQPKHTILFTTTTGSNITVGAEAGMFTGSLDGEVKAMGNWSAKKLGCGKCSLAEWLAGGSAISTSAAVKSEGELLLEDTKTAIGKVDVSCGLVLVGTAGPGAEGEFTVVLNLAGEAVSESGGLALLGTGKAGTDCVSHAGCAEGSEASPIEVRPKGLPWTTLLALVSPSETFLDTFTKMGWRISCLVLGVRTEDECAGETSAGASNVTGGVEVLFNESSEATACTQGGAGAGVFRSVGANLTSLVEGGTLSVS